MIRSIVVMILVMILHLQAALGAEEGLSALESWLANKMRLAVELSREANQLEMPTNMVQIVPRLTVEAWAMMEAKFKRFDGQAGFSNSIFEKYVFLPRGITFQHGPAKAEALLMNAQPFLDTKGGTNRWVVHSVGEEIDHCLLSEVKVQEMMKRSGVEVPKPIPMVSAIELDTPRRREEARTQQEMEDEIRRLVAQEGQGTGRARPPRVQIPPPASQQPKDKPGDTIPESPSPSSRMNLVGISLVILLGSVIAIYAFRQAKRSDGERKK